MPESGKALAVIQSFARPCEGKDTAHTDTLLYQRDKQAVLELLRRPWFERIWVRPSRSGRRRNIVMKCGADEISGTVFALGLKKARNVLWNDGDNMNQRERRVLDGILKSAASLISDAGFRPRFEKVTSSDRYYLNVQPLWRLINIYRQRQATDRRDKIYALLGMSSEDPGASSLLPDYSISWETAVRRSAHALGILRPESSVIMNACDDSDFVLIRGKGRVLARLKDSWTTGTLMVCWSDIGVALGWSDGKRLSNDIHSVFPTPSEELREGDVLFLLETGSTPLLVRVCSDYLRILQI
ncbi:hypothetical protein QBC35DRAFT_396025, partial [Podospora australis]